MSYNAVSVFRSRARPAKIVRTTKSTLSFLSLFERSYCRLIFNNEEYRRVCDLPVSILRSPTESILVEKVGENTLNDISLRVLGALFGDYNAYRSGDASAAAATVHSLFDEFPVGSEKVVVPASA